MSDNDSGFPTLPVSRWWEIRDRFKKTIPTILKDSNLATILDIKVISARNNLLPSLRKIGFIDSEGKVQDIARDWRDDTKYESVCKKILGSVYPKDLHESFPEPGAEIEGVRRWFAHTTGAGESAVGKMAAFYQLLSEGKIQTDAPKPKATRSAQSGSTPKKPKATEEERLDHESSEPKNRSKRNAEIHINLQIHISPELSLEQIDKVFESIAKHLKQ